MEQRDLIVIGAGPGGYVAALRAAQLGMSVALIDKQPFLGGTCLNVGCIPSKTLLFATEQLAWIQQHGASWGIQGSVQADITTMMERKTEVVSGFRQGIHSLCQRAKIHVIEAAAELQGGNRVRLSTGEELQGRWILLAAGSEPIVLPSIPVDEETIVTSTGALSLKKVPKRLIVIGAGVIGVELGSVYQRLGSQVTFIEATAGICPGLDGTIVKSFQALLEAQGLQFRLNQKVKSCQKRGDVVDVVLDSGEQLEADVVLVAIGRRPYTAGLGLDKAGVTPGPGGRLVVDGRFWTGVDGIYAIGDLIDGPMLAHKASEEAVVCVEGLAGLPSKIDYISVPNVIYTHPEVATVGLTEEQARGFGLKVHVGTFPFKANSRARCCGEVGGLVKVIGEEGSDRLLGIHIVGAHASELIAVGVLAMQQGVRVAQLAHCCMAHPTLSEALKEAALDFAKSAIHK
ncbi:MAG: dihydrolipoyl dehydrogenase [Chlamydiia bacterium]